MSLRDEVVKLAAGKPELRKHLVPILRKTGGREEIVSAVTNFIDNQRTFFELSDETVGHHGESQLFYRIWYESPFFPKKFRDSEPNKAEAKADPARWVKWQKDVATAAVHEAERLAKAVIHEVGKDRVSTHIQSETDWGGEDLPNVDFLVELPDIPILRQGMAAFQTDPKIDAAIKEFVEFVTNTIHTNMKKNFANLPLPKVYAEWGQRYVRIVKEDNQRVVFGFVDRTNGDILKAEGWKKPAKHARGNVLDRSTWAGSHGPYGMTYLRG